MSSATDVFHSDPSHLRGNPTVINALELPPEGSTVRGLHIRSFPAMESFTFDFGRDPDANALYLVALGRIRVLHMGDIGNPVSPAHLDTLRGERRLAPSACGCPRDIARGATLLPKTNALAVNIRAGKVTGLTTAKSTIEAPVVVDAAGAWTRQVAEASGIRVPLVPTYRPASNSSSQSRQSALVLG
jgi:hypothetical protein